MCSLKECPFLVLRKNIETRKRKKKEENSAGVSESSIHTSHPIPKNLRADKGE